jgi:hypothetical protein
MSRALLWVGAIGLAACSSGCGHWEHGHWAHRRGRFHDHRVEAPNQDHYVKAETQERKGHWAERDTENDPFH